MTGRRLSPAALRAGGSYLAKFQWAEPLARIERPSVRWTHTNQPLAVNNWSLPGFERVLTGAKALVLEFWPIAGRVSGAVAAGERRT
jgi:hypothetical protein